MEQGQLETMVGKLLALEGKLAAETHAEYQRWAQDYRSWLGAPERSAPAFREAVRQAKATFIEQAKGARATAKDVPPGAPEPAQETAPQGVDHGVPRTPKGFKAVVDAGPEPYTGTGWAKGIIHEQTGIQMAYVPAGEFMMGTTKEEGARYGDLPQHRVTLTKGFYLGKYEVTQSQWKAVMGSNPSRFRDAGEDAPVENVSWNDCRTFLDQLNAKYVLPNGDTKGTGFRFPTEAEWEYACRAATKDVFAGELVEMAWFYSNSGQTTHPVGQKRANKWGLYDMHGNVMEWCLDWCANYRPVAVTDPIGPPGGLSRIFRGGSWASREDACRSASRNAGEPDSMRGHHLGLRLAFSLEKPE